MLELSCENATVGTNGLKKKFSLEVKYLCINNINYVNVHEKYVINFSNRAFIYFRGALITYTVFFLFKKNIMNILILLEYI